MKMFYISQVFVSEWFFSLVCHKW